ncbi:MAG: hypothetical protein UT34_C0002G0267 [candidate division WS6 bacterium GW2011_GWF2_39_15]|uniref:DUF456 domain-containing protein n=1 Tax=candidate division WS6 bacterium GW2011_GWF2_39_15 TaxID=1619100 RepID=A0A0G0Q5S0_9BACT|nr:MAG: hypothetical protein UT34_C0002G0267 [candidate division WS6 bacterium GW2011_GWF2_39_15]
MELIIYTILLIGFLLSFINLPGPWIMFLAALITRISSASDIGWGILTIFFILALFASIADNLFVIFGAKKFGGGKWGMIGAVVGLLVGILIGNLVGGILGPFFGAFLFEYLIAKKDSNVAFKAGLGTVLGLLGGIILKVLISLIMGIWIIGIIN